MIGDLINSQNISWYMQVNGKRIRFLIVINVKGQTGHLYEKFMSQVWMVGYINLVHTGPFYSILTKNLHCVANSSSKREWTKFGNDGLSVRDQELTGLKFIYSEKATTFLRNLHLFLTGTSISQKKVKISQNFCCLLRISAL